MNNFSAGFCIDYFNGIKPLIAMGNIKKLEIIFAKQIEVLKKVTLF